MKLIFKQKVFTWFDEYEIFDENESVIYRIKSKFGWGRKLQIYDKQDCHIASLESIFSFGPKYRILIGGNEIGIIRKEFAFFKPQFNIDFNGWSVDGDFWERNYEIKENGNVVAKINKEFRWFSDVYAIDVVEEKDGLLALLVVLTIDAIKAGSSTTN